MICFDVYVNGEKLCRAGKDDLRVMTCILSWGKTGRDDEDLALSVGGLAVLESGGNAHSRWPELSNFRIGDEISIRIVDADDPDEPADETIETPEWIQEQKRKYFESVRAEFENDSN